MGSTLALLVALAAPTPLDEFGFLPEGSFVARTRVLIVDREPITEQLLREGLLREGWCTRRAACAAEALMQHDRWAPDVVLLDLNLPDADGFAFLKQLRQRGRTPIVVVSSVAGRAEKIRALDLGADDYVTKPFDTGELQARVRAALRRVKGDSASSVITSFVCGPLCVDFQREAVSLGGSSVRLTPTEYRLLRELTQNAGKLMSRSALLSRVWGTSHLEETEYLSAFIRRLRRKIEPDPRRPVYILTEHRAGYRFVPPDDLSKSPFPTGYAREPKPDGLARYGRVPEPNGQDSEGFATPPERGG